MTNTHMNGKNHTRVVLESPYGAATPTEIERNVRYLRMCLHDAIVVHGEAPMASHGLYTQPGVLRDHVPEERALGISLGFAWRDVAEKTVVYTDLGISTGMKDGICHAR